MATKTKFSGLSDSQVLLLFKQIATTSHLIAGICRDKAEELGEHEAALTFHAIDTMLSGIGALADLPTGGDVVGDFADWMVGPIFRGDHSEVKS